VGKLGQMELTPILAARKSRSLDCARDDCVARCAQDDNLAGDDEE